METTIHLNLSEDFNTLCTIYQIKPEYFIQTFINQVSFPEYYSRPTAKDRWATLFFLQFLQVECASYNVNRELEKQHLTLFKDAMMYKFETEPENNPVLIKTGREVMRQWLKAVQEEPAASNSSEITV